MGEQLCCLELSLYISSPLWLNFQNLQLPNSLIYSKSCRGKNALHVEDLGRKIKPMKTYNFAQIKVYVSQCQSMIRIHTNCNLTQLHSFLEKYHSTQCTRAYGIQVTHRKISGLSSLVSPSLYHTLPKICIDYGFSQCLFPASISLQHFSAVSMHKY